MPVLGTCRVRIRNPKNNKKYNAEFLVVKGDHTPLIGSRASQQMNLVTVQSYPGSIERGIWRRVQRTGLHGRKTSP